MQHSAERRDAEVLQFNTTSESYTIYVHPDLRLDVARCQAKPRPEQRDSFMWVQAVQGFFVLHQDLSEPQPGPWKVIFEVSPDRFSSSFFPWVDDEFFELLKRWEELPPLSQPDSQEGSSACLDNPPDGD